MKVRGREVEGAGAEEWTDGKCSIGYLGFI